MNIVWSENPYQQMISEQVYLLQTALFERGLPGLMEQAKNTFVVLANHAGEHRPDVWTIAMAMDAYRQTELAFKVDIVDAITTRGIKQFADITRTAHNSLVTITTYSFPKS